MKHQAPHVGVVFNMPTFLVGRFWSRKNAGIAFSGQRLARVVDPELERAVLHSASAKTKRKEMMAESIAISGIPEDVVAKPALRPRQKASVEAIRSSICAIMAWN